MYAHPSVGRDARSSKQMRDKGPAAPNHFNRTPGPRSPFRPMKTMPSSSIGRLSRSLGSNFLLWRLYGLASVTCLCGWRREGSANGFGLPLYDHNEGAGGDVRLTATLLPIANSIDRKAKLIGELSLRCLCDASSRLVRRGPCARLRARGPINGSILRSSGHGWPRTGIPGTQAHCNRCLLHVGSR